MRQPEDFRYILIHNREEFTLPHAPSGWEDALLNWERSKDYHGMMRTYSQPMVFVLDGAWLLRKFFYSEGLKADTKIRIEQLNRDTWRYHSLYVGEIDYSTFEDRMFEVEVSIMEGGISSLVKAYDNVKYEIPLDDIEAIEVRIPGIGLVENGSSIFETGVFLVSSQFTRLMGIDVIDNNFLNENITYKSTTQGITEDIFSSEEWHVRANAATNVAFSGKLKGTYTNPSTSTATWIDIRNQNNVIRKTIASLVQADSSPIPFEVEIDFNLSLFEGEKLFFAYRSLGSGFRNVTIEEGEISATNSLVTQDTVCKALRPKTLFDRLLAKMNGGFAVESQSFFLTDDNWKRVVVTCGDAIRQIENPKIITTFKEFFNSYNSIGNVGFGVENGKAVLEAKEYFWVPNLQSVDVGDVKEFNLSPATDYMYSSIKVGYNDHEYEVEYGREEVNSTQQYATPLKRSQQELNLISPYRADQLGIEDLRITPAEQNANKTDNKADNDVFMIKIQDEPVDGIYDVEGSEAYMTIEGFSARNSYYNLDLTPKKNLLRHGNFLRSMLHHFEGRHIRFESAEKNQEVKTVDLEGNTVTEKEWVPVSALGERIFLPYIARITCKLPKNAASFMGTFPRGFVRFQYKGYHYRGFIMDASVDVARNSEREFTLIMHPDNNLLNLVH